MSYPLGSALNHIVDDLRESGDSQRQQRRGQASLHTSPILVREDEKAIGMGLMGKSADQLKVASEKMPATGLTSQQRQAQRSNVAMPATGSSTGSSTGSTGSVPVTGSSLGSSTSGTNAANITPSPSPIFTTNTAVPSPAPGTTGSGLGGSGLGGSGIGSEFVGTSSASGMPSFGSSSGLENGVPRADSSRFMDDAVARISGSGLSYWDEQKASAATAQPRSKKPVQSQGYHQAYDDEEEDTSVPISRILISGVLFIMCLAMVMVAAWGLSAAMGWSKPGPDTPQKQFEMMGMMMLAGGSVLGLFMGGASIYVMFLHHKLGSKKKRRR